MTTVAAFESRWSRTRIADPPMSESRNPTDDSIDHEIDDRYAAFENQGTVVIYDKDEPDSFVQSDEAVTLAEAR